MREIDVLRQGFETAYIDGNVASDTVYRPQFVSNNYKEGKRYFRLLKTSFCCVRSFRLVWLLLHWGGNRTDSSDIEGIGREEYSRRDIDNQLSQF